MLEVKFRLIIYNGKVPNSAITTFLIIVYHLASYKIPAVVYISFLVYPTQDSYNKHHQHTYSSSYFTCPAASLTNHFILIPDVGVYFSTTTTIQVFCISFPICQTTFFVYVCCFHFHISISQKIYKL